MFTRVAVVYTPQCGQVRNMATLKAISMRLKSVTSIQKITKSMKMVSAAKYAKAERELKPARVYGHGAQAFYKKAEIPQNDKASNQLVVAVTSDRGLCGSCHTGIAKAIRSALPQKAPGTTTKIICIGDKSRAILGRTFKQEMLMQFNDVGKKPPSFIDATIIANEILKSGYEFEFGEMYYNTFKTVVSYNLTVQPLFTHQMISNAENINKYDSLDEDVIKSYNEFSLASLIYFAMKESSCSEQSSRMTAMDSATKNAGEMIDKLRLTYNRTRQAVITRELVEIISGAAALK